MITERIPGRLAAQPHPLLALLLYYYLLSLLLVVVVVVVIVLVVVVLFRPQGFQDSAQTNKS